MSAPAIERVRELEDARKAIFAHFTALISELTSIIHGSAQASKHFITTWTRADMHAALEKRGQVSQAEEMTYLLHEQIKAGLPDRLFREQNPQARETLLWACQCRLANAREEFNRVLDGETERLSGKGFDSEQIEASPEVKRARHRVEALERLYMRIADDPEETVWNNAHALLK